ncbi:ankyrin [Teratosphaeria nubilosa]|uniref:Ankyrin n=1 Tax=Teratosphaeria nubilosa TaxID=161662 RepID=A0A6G1LLP9_9PEZI|nr:ankyrin [Teratosphaeria nubilosa]
MDYDLPQFEPVPLPAVIDDAEVLRGRHLRPEDTEIANAEALCHAGDVSAATANINQLLHAGTPVQKLQFCLLGAVLSGSEDLVQMLLNAGVPVSLVNVKPAIKRKSLQILSLFLHYGWNINESEDWCLPPLLSYAIATEPDEALISWFLSNGANPNARCEMDITPLSTAVGCAPLPVIKQLFAHCPPSTSLGGQLLHWAARRASDDAEDVVQFLLEHCQPDLNKILYEDDVFSYEVRRVVGLGTALHEAARTGRPSVVQMLIQKGTDVSIRDSCGNTALEVAEIHGNLAATALLRNAEKELSAKM